MSFLTGTPLDDLISLFLIQLLIILILPRILNAGLKYLNQPLVVAEILSGIILGPSILGKIPGFSNTIFPKTSLPLLNLFAQFALVLYLFLVGLSLDPAKIKQNWRKSIIAWAFGIAFTYVAAVPLAYLLHKSIYTTANVGTLVGVLGISYNTSALAVLARIYGENNLLDSLLAIVSLPASAMDIFSSWIILAILLAFNTNNTGRKLAHLDPLWIVFLTIAQALIMWFIGRRFLKSVCDTVKKSGTLSTINFIVILLVVFVVAWFTDQVGISAMLGALEVGLLFPRKGPTVKFLKDKLEDITVGVLIPIFFTFSGLRTDLSLLNTGETIGLTILIFVVAMASKSIPTVIAARICKLNWRESFAFGVLITCKGLFALVMFNIFADKDIITPRLFTMLVVYCLATTVVVPPLTAFILHYKKQKMDKEVVVGYLETTNVLVCPQTPKLAPPTISFAHALTKAISAKQLFVVRFLSVSDGISSDLMSDKPKFDQILGPAIQRSHFFKVKLNTRTIATDNEPEALSNFVSTHNVVTTIIGYDSNEATKHLISGALRSGMCDIAVQCGEDLGEIDKILVTYGNSANDEVAFQFVMNILASHKADVTILNVSKNKGEYKNLHLLVDSLNKYLGTRTIVQGTSDDPIDSILTSVDISEFSVVIHGFIPSADSQVNPAELFEVFYRVSDVKSTPFVVVHSKSLNVWEQNRSHFMSPNTDEEKGLESKPSEFS